MRTDHGGAFRELLRRGRPLLLPGCYDAISAKILVQAGFGAIYMSGSAVTASLLGEPDVGLLGFHEMLEQARRIVMAADVPVICDADTGYGNAINVRRAIREYEGVGVAGVHLEDQVFPKRCGHFEGKAVIPAREMAAKIKAAVEARRDANFFVIARTDARAVEGLESTIERSRLYREAGADALFVEALRTTEEMARVNEEFADMPLLVNVVEGGKTPQLSFAAYGELGYSIVLYPTASIRIVMKALKGLAAQLRAEGSTEGMLEQLVGFEERNEITGLAGILELEQRYSSS